MAHVFLNEDAYFKVLKAFASGKYDLVGFLLPILQLESVWRWVSRFLDSSGGNEEVPRGEAEEGGWCISLARPGTNHDTRSIGRRRCFC